MDTRAILRGANNFMKQVLLIISFITGCVCLQAQTKKLDSLQVIISNHPAKDTIRVNLILNYVKATANENTSMILPYLGELISISKNKNYKRGIQEGYIAAQLYYSDRGDFTNSIMFADSAFQALGKDTSRRSMINIAYLHNNVAGDYLKLGDYDQAISHYTKSAQMLEQYNPKVASVVYGGMAEVYDKLLQPQKAIEYNRKAILIAEKSGDKASITRRYLDFIGRMVNAKKFDTVEVLLDKIEPLVKEIDESFSSFYFNQNKGYLLQHQQKYAEAIAYYKKAKASAIKSDDQYQYLTILDPLSQSQMKAGLMEEAKLTLDTLLNKSKKNKMNFGLLYAYTNLAEWYSLKADYKTANDYLHKKMLLSDSIASDEIQEKIMMTETRYRVQAKDNEIKNLQTEKTNQQLLIRQKSTWNFILFAGALALLIISLLGYRNYRHKQNLQQQRISELETQQQLSATEAVLQGEEQERTRLAKDLHDGLGGMLSSVKYSFNNMKGNLIMTPENAQAFERSIDMLDSSIQEMRRVAHNMMPEALVKFGLDTALKDFCNEIERSGALAVQYQSIGLENLELPQIKAIGIYRMVQELMNNILKHAAAKTAIVQLSKREDMISITVEDDGKGFDKNILQNTKGMGWNNIENRVDFFKGKYDVNTEIGKGTSVLIEINI